MVMPKSRGFVLFAAGKTLRRETVGIFLFPATPPRYRLPPVAVRTENRNVPFAAAQGLWESEDGHRFTDKAFSRRENPLP